MTKQELMQYRKLGREIALLREQVAAQEEEMRRMRNPDVVRGSSPSFPYVLHSIPVAGTADPEVRAEYRETIAALRRTIRARQKEMRRLEKYIAGIRDSELRQVFILRYMEGLSFQKIAVEMGQGNAADALRKRVERHFKFP